MPQEVDQTESNKNQAVENLLPHRPPFLFVDRLEQTTNNSIIVGYKRFSADEPFFSGHFPAYPVVPGVLLVEALAQCGGAGIAAQNDEPGSILFLATVEKAKFRRQVRPNEEVRLEVTTTRKSKSMIRQSGKAYVDNELAAEASWLCLRGSTNNIPQGF